MRGATVCRGPRYQDTTISIHTPHAGSDPTIFLTIAPNPRFQSTLPMRGATYAAYYFPQITFISIHTPHAGSDDKGRGLVQKFLLISIHTPHAGSDRYCPVYRRGRIHFNPHSPCGERRDGWPAHQNHCQRFQSTLPMRGATIRFWWNSSW